jgi:hypothetical protein
MGTGDSFPGVKVRPGRFANHSAPSGAEVKKERGYKFSPYKRLSWHVAGQLYNNLVTEMWKDSYFALEDWSGLIYF